jgi:hypothetical protein
VALSFKGRRFAESDRVEAPGRQLDVIRAIAAATIRTIEQFVEGQFSCELQAVQRARALEKDLVVLLINLAFEGRSVQLIGSCRTSDDISGAAARAALDATNRYIGFVMEYPD